jgi:hypothetical protein
VSTALGSPMVIWAAVLLFEVMDKEISATKLATILLLLGFAGFLACRKSALFLPVFLLPGIASFVLLTEEFMDASVRDAILQEGGISYPIVCSMAIAGSLALPIWGTLIGKRRRLETNGQ